MKYVLLFLALCAFACTSNKYAGVPEKYHALLDQALAKAGANAPELEKALAEAPANQKEGMAFLIAYMPERDLLELKADFLLENAAYAYKAREQYPWAKAVPPIRRSRMIEIVICFMSFILYCTSLAW